MAAVVSNLERLVAHVLDGARPGAADTQPPPTPARAGLLAYLGEVLASRLAPAEPLDEAHLLDVIRRRLLRRDPTAESTLRFTELHQRLVELGLLRNRAAMLYLLYALAEQTPPSTFVERPFGMASLQPSAAPLEGNTRELIASAEHSVAARKPPAVHIIGFDEYNRQLKANHLNETDLLRDVLFVLQGIDGRVVRYERTLDGFALDVGDRAAVSMPMRRLLLGLAELGWHYRRVTQLLQKQKGLVDAGLVSQSLCLAVDEELLEYHRLLVVLESQLEAERSDEQLTGLTLKRLLVWVQEPLVRLKMLSVILDGCQGLKGGALVSGVHGYVRHGDPAVSGLVHRLLRRTCQPYFEMLRKWVVEGQLMDVHAEFFVLEQRLDRDAWTSLYHVQPELVPSFFSPSLVRQLFSIGRSLNFLRDVCGDKDWSLLRALEASGTPLPDDARWLSYADLVALGRVVGSIDAAVSTHLLDVIRTKHELMVHLRGMKQYLLMGQGDFVQMLMEMLWDDLGKPASKLMPHQLTSTLHSAVRSSNAQNDHPEVQRRLGVRLHEISAGESGWDVFSLDYHVDPPLSSVFTRAAMVSYYRVFTFLWKIRRIEFALNRSWRLLVGVQPVAELRQELHALFLLRAEMSHMLSEFQYYVLIEVLEWSWDELLRDMAEAKDFDAVIDAHQRYIRSLTSKALLDEASKPLRTRLNSLLLAILQFYHLVGSVTTLLDTEQRRREALQAHVDERTKRGGWGTTRGSKPGEALPEAVVQGELPPLRAKLAAVTADFRAHLQVFLVEIGSAPVAAHLPLQTLRARLDFNDFYAAGAPAALLGGGSVGSGGSGSR